MKHKFPFTIQNVIGEKLVFQRMEADPAGDKLIVENFVQPGVGPLMHTHWLQDECLTVVTGKIGYQLQGQQPQYAGEGETVLFKRGVAHRFWNAGNEVLHCEGWVQPAHSFVYFLSGIFNAQNIAGKAQPEKFDAAFLMTRYASEFELNGIPKFVKKLVIPLTYRVGHMLGKYKKFRDAPEPVRAAV